MVLFIPSNQLLKTAGNSQKANSLNLASSEWFDLQNNVQAVLALPSDFGEYQDRYGDASSGLQMKECFKAMHDLQNVASKYGNSKSLRASILKNPNFLADAERPRNDAFSATVWTLERAHQNAFSLASTLRDIPSNARGEKPSEVVAGIKSLFLDTDQIVDQMRQTVKQLDMLIEEFQTIEDELEAAQAAMENYTKNSSKTRNFLDKEIGDLNDKIKQLEKERDAAYQKWLALTISACVVPAVIGVVGVGLTVVVALPATAATFGTAAPAVIGGGAAATGVLATAAAAGLDVAASKANDSYHKLIEEVKSKQEFRQKRIAYRHDLGALDKSMKFSLPNSKNVISQIQVLREAWISSINEIRFTVGDLNTDNLASGPWLNQQEMATSAANWTQVDDALKAFINGSFVDSNLIPFGSELPQNDPDWKQKFVQLAA